MKKIGKCVIISAPSGAGKTTIVKNLLKMGLGLEFSVSLTSRLKRGEEVEGKDYYFVSENEFRKNIKEGKLVEWEEVYPGQFYGTLKSEIERVWEKGKAVIFDVDVVGGLNLKEKFKDKALAIFIMPPSLEDLKKRLKKRATESPEKISQRVEKAKDEMTMATAFDKIVINDDLTHAVGDAENHIREFLNQ